MHKQFYKFGNKEPECLYHFHKQRFCPLAGLLATVPANPNNGANGSTVGGVTTGTSQGPAVSSEGFSTYEGTSRTGTSVRWLTLSLVKIQFFVC